MGIIPYQEGWDDAEERDFCIVSAQNNLRRYSPNHELLSLAHLANEILFSSEDFHEVYRNFPEKYRFEAYLLDLHQAREKIILGLWEKRGLVSIASHLKEAA